MRPTAPPWAPWRSAGARVATAMLTATLAAGCSGSGGGSASSSPGSSSQAPSSASSSSEASASSVAPSGAGGSASVAAPPSTTGTAPVASPSAATCAPGAVTVTGAPFCYPLPTGFTDYSRLTTYAKSWTYRTLVSINTQDLIEVLGAAADRTDGLTDLELLTQQYRPYYQLKVGSLGIVQASAVQATSVDGARAFNQTAVYRGGVATDATTVFFGRFVVSIQCQSKTSSARVADACRSVRSTMSLSR